MTRISPEFAPDERADEATKKILLLLLDAIESNEAGTRDGVDIEYLHDFRVAVRRTRSALAQIKGVLPKDVVSRYKKEFAWLGRLTTPTRDLDVFLSCLAGYREILPPDMRQGFEPFGDYLRAQRAVEQAVLAEGIASERFRTLAREWRAFLEETVAEKQQRRRAARPVLGLARARIWRVYGRAVLDGRAVHTKSPALVIHELRKTCKKLRYLIEFFQSLFPDERVEQLVAALKNLQDDLGEFQDFEVQLEILQEYRATTRPEVSPAVEALIDELEHRQRDVRKRGMRNFNRFALETNQEIARGLFAGT